MIDRRDFLRSSVFGAVSAGALGSFATPSLAQAMDSLRIFVPANPGGGWDQTARTIEHVLKAANMVKTVQVTNVGGAGGTVGLPQFLNQWKGQGNALMVAGMVMVGAIITAKSPLRLSQTTPIARLTGEFEVIVVPANSPHKDMKSLVAALKADPGKVSWAGGSAGGTDHILVGMIARAVGVEPAKTAYVAFAGGGPAQAAILGSQVTAGVSGWGEFSEQVKAGKMRALALSSEKRQAGIDVPTLKEQGVDVELSNWRGVFAPPGVTPQQRQAMIDYVDRMAKSPQWQEELKKRDWTPILQTGDAFNAYIESEHKRIEAILKDLGLG